MQVEAIRSNIAAAVTLSNDAMERLLGRLEALGVCIVADLIDVTLDDIILNSEHPDGILLPIHARRLIRLWSADAGAASSPSHLVNTSITPSSSVFQSQSRAPALSTPTTPLSTVDTNSNNWHQQFDIDVCLAEMMAVGQPLKTQHAAKCLKEGKPVTAALRNELVRCVSDNILQRCRMPARSSINIVAEQIVTKYSHIRDEIEGSVVGTGFTSFRNQLENRIVYLKRPLSVHRIRTLAKRHAAHETEPSDNEPSTSKKKQMRDGYGCVNFLPTVMPDGETHESLSVKQKQLKELYSSQRWNEADVSALMTDTYIIQRQDLVGVDVLSVADIKSEWPYLCEPRWFFEHLKSLLGIMILEKMEENLLTKKSSLIGYLRSKSSVHRELRKRIAEIDVEDASVLIIIPLLMTYFKEDEQVLFRGYEV
jgi:hypothetical protein